MGINRFPSVRSGYCHAREKLLDRGTSMLKHSNSRVCTNVSSVLRELRFGGYFGGLDDGFYKEALVDPFRSALTKILIDGGKKVAPGATRVLTGQGKKTFTGAVPRNLLPGSTPSDTVRQWSRIQLRPSASGGSTSTPTLPPLRPPGPRPGGSPPAPSPGGSPPVSPPLRPPAPPPGGSPPVPPSGGSPGSSFWSDPLGNWARREFAAPKKGIGLSNFGSSTAGFMNPYTGIFAPDSEGKYGTTEAWVRALASAAGGGFMGRTYIGNRMLTNASALGSAGWTAGSISDVLSGKGLFSDDKDSMAKDLWKKGFGFGFGTGVVPRWAFSRTAKNLLYKYPGKSSDVLWSPVKKVVDAAKNNTVASAIAATGAAVAGTGAYSANQVGKNITQLNEQLGQMQTQLEDAKASVQNALSSGFSADNMISGVAGAVMKDPLLMMGILAIVGGLGGSAFGGSSGAIGGAMGLPLLYYLLTRGKGMGGGDQGMVSNPQPGEQSFQSQPGQINTAGFNRDDPVVNDLFYKFIQNRTGIDPNSPDADKLLNKFLSDPKSPKISLSDPSVAAAFEAFVRQQGYNLAPQ
jgi:hypothetical protein